LIALGPSDERKRPKKDIPSAHPLWQPHDSRVSVAVNDTKSGDAFELEVRSGQRALDVFHHPYAYAIDPSTITFEHETPAARSRP
jgi:hypothetical protein